MALDFFIPSSRYVNLGRYHNLEIWNYFYYKAFKKFSQINLGLTRLRLGRNPCLLRRLADLAYRYEK
ncbi:MAG: hypothetical protein AMS27_00120 [Bacteroides sp. SM23_62_1]|nr:MAG: hypothetical protein AMS27_00120 [Bacteroides sp. SM23_62_1]